MITEESLYESGHVHSYTKRVCVILDARYENAYLHKFMETQFQNLTLTQRTSLLKLSQKFEELLDGTLGTCKIDLSDFELKEDTNPICSRPYPVPKVHEEIFKKEVDHLSLLGVLKVAHYSEWESLSFAQP